MKTLKQTFLKIRIGIYKIKVIAKDAIIKPINELKLSENLYSSKGIYNKHEKEYSIKRDINLVWENYINSNVKELWNTYNARCLNSFNIKIIVN